MFEHPSNQIRKCKLRTVSDQPMATQITGMRDFLPPGPFLYGVAVKHGDSRPDCLGSYPGPTT